MKMNFAVLCAQLSLVAAVASPANAQPDITALQRRIAELEAQNRQIMQLLAELSSEPQRRQAGQPEPATAVPAQVDLPEAVVTEDNHSRLSFYGFARIDAIFDDSRPSASQTPIYILPETAATENEGSFTMHPRLTRMGMNYRGPVVEMLGGARLSGRIETDFQNGGRESRALLRYRHAYAKLDWERSSLLLGQTSDIISPLYPSVNADTLMWNAGNLGDRRMQVRYTYNPDSRFSFIAGLGLTGAVDSQDLDGNGVRDGEDASLPHLQARAGYASPLFDVGVWGHAAALETTTAFNGQTGFNSHSIGLDFAIRPLERISLRGEVWTGQALSDIRGGIGQSINTLTGQEIDSSGGWIELGFKPTSIYSASLGWTVDNPDNDDLAPGSRKLNRAWYITNQLRLGQAFMIGLDYLYWTTNYIGLPEGTDNRLNFYSVYRF